MHSRQPILGDAEHLRRGAVAAPGKRVDAGGDGDGFNGPIVPFNGAFSLGVGGYIDVWGTGNRQNSLSVANWRVRRMFEQQPLHCSGNLGGTDYRQIGYSYQWQADILWDYRIPADTTQGFRWIKGAELVFWLGDILDLQLQRFRQSPGDTDDIDYPFLWCPDAVLASGDTMLDALAKKMTRVPCQGVARSHIFVCPVEGTPSDEATKAGAYRKWYQTSGPENQNAGA